VNARRCLDSHPLESSLEFATDNDKQTQDDRSLVAAALPLKHNCEALMMKNCSLEQVPVEVESPKTV